MAGRPPEHGINSKLTHDDLFEVFLRLPSAESATQCKVVCKLWYSLLSQSDFPTLFIANKISSTFLCMESLGEEGDKQEVEVPFAYCIWFMDQYMRSAIYPNDSAFIFPCPSFSLSFIPNDGVITGGQCLPIHVLASSGDFLLCSSRIHKKSNLYVCNPRTKQFVQLPPPVRNIGRASASLTLDPYYTFDLKTGSVFTPRISSRYCVCYFIPPCNNPTMAQFIPMKIEIFFSKTRAWRMAYLVPTKGRNYLEYTISGSFTYDGMIHIYWTDAIVVFNPYKIRSDGFVSSHSIGLPPFVAHLNRNTVWIGVCGGRIRMIQYSSNLSVHGKPEQITDVGIPPEEQQNNFYIKVWELKNYSTGEWSLERTVYFHELVSEDATLNEHLKRGCPLSIVVHIHPSKPHLLLVGCFKIFAECNLVEKTLEPFHPITSRYIRYGLTLSWWPTPLEETL